MPVAPLFTYTNQSLDPFYGPGLAKSDTVALQASTTYTYGQVLGEITGASAVYTQTFTGCTAGTATLTYQGQSTPAFTAVAGSLVAAATIQGYLTALPAIGAGNVTVALAANVYTITFAGTLANTPITLTQTLAGITGTTPTLVYTTSGVTPTGTFGPYIHSGAGGLGVPKALLAISCATDAYGNISLGAIAGAAQWGQVYPTVPAWFFGFFSLADVIAGNTNSLTNLIGDSFGWSIELGSITAGTGLLRIG